MKTLQWVLVGFLLSLPVQAQITSTQAGGSWSETGTWVGGVVPTAADDVVVAGPVVVYAGNTCRNLTINPSGSIADGPGNFHTETLVVEGTLRNEGVIANGAGVLNLSTRGNLINVGTWTPNLTALDGTATQTLSVENQAPFGGSWRHNNDAGVAAGSDLYFDGASFDLRGRTFTADGYMLSATSSVRIFNGTIGGTYRLVGTHQVISGLVLSGTITNEGMLEDDQGNFHVETLRVEGTLINRGEIRDTNGLLHIWVNGEAVNEGIWHNDVTRFIGPTAQRLSHTMGHPLSGGWSLADTAALVASSDLVFENAYIDLNAGTLSMDTYALTGTNSTTLREGTVTGPSLRMDRTSVLGYSRWEGPLSLHGNVPVWSGTVFEGPVTVVDTLSDGGGNFHTETLVVEGTLRNEGVIANGAGVLNLSTRGNLINVGTWTPNLTALDGTATQTLSVENQAPFGGSWRHNNDAGVAAGSDLYFDGASFDLRGRTFTADGYMLSATSSVRIFNGTIGGTYRLVGTHQVISGLVLSGTITNEGMLEDDQGNFHVETLRVEGTLINRGEIRDTNGLLHIWVNGEVQNEGIWHNDVTRFIGPTAQRLSHTTGQPLGGGWAAADSVVVTATSPLVFSGASVDLDQGWLAMDDYPLTLDATWLGDGNIDVRELTMSGNATLGLGTFLSGTISLRGAAQVFNDTVFEGPVTVVDTLRDAPGNFFIETITVQKALYNEGVIQGNLVIQAEGDVINFAEWDNRGTNLAGTGVRTLRGERIASPISVTGENVVLTGTITLDVLTIGNEAFVRLDGNGILHIPPGGLRGTVSQFANYGQIVVKQEARTSRTLTYHDLTLRTPAELDIDTLQVRTFGNQVPEVYGSAVRNWWRFEPPTTTTTTLPSVTFAYTEQQLGANVEAELEVYHSTDGGSTWLQLSTSQNLTRDTERNTVTLANAPASGDYIVSSIADPTAVLPNVIMSITGRPNIRIGAPNRYLVHYVNNSQVPTGDMLMVLHLERGGHILRIEPAGGEGDTQEVLEAEELFDDDVLADTMATLYVRSLDPGQERSFFVVAMGDPDIVSKAGESQALITLGGAVLILGSVAEGLILSYVFDAATEACKAFFEDRLTWRQSLERAAERTFDRWSSVVVPLKNIFTNAGESLVEAGFGLGNGAITVGKTAISCSIDVFNAVIETLGYAGYLLTSGPAIDGIQRRCDPNWGGGGKRAAVEGCPISSTYGTSVSLPTVRSWDPNEKNGPAGYGEAGYITSAGRMNYTILFENKAEATAEAYRVFITDTLDAAVFDPATVVFGETSHEGFTMTREDNILTWDIEGIELPPNMNPPEGEGFVTFSVETRPGLASSTSIENHATIIFDLNPPITTNTVVNTLDFEAPVTTMLLLAETTPRNEVVVRWNSDDGTGGSGVGRSSVFQAVGGGGFQLVGTTTADSLVVPVETDGVYSYYVLAIDQVGNAEAVHPEAVSTQVVFVGTEPDEQPVAFALHANYPNPFNPTTTISYTLPQASQTTLHVYDVTGRRVETLVNGVQVGGRHQVEWDARNLASGVYFYRLQQAQHTAIRPMVLLK